MSETHEGEEAKDGIPKDGQAKNHSSGPPLVQSVRYGERKGGSLLRVKRKMWNGQADTLSPGLRRRNPCRNDVRTGGKTEGPKTKAPGPKKCQVRVKTKRSGTDQKSCFRDAHQGQKRQRNNQTRQRAKVPSTRVLHHRRQVKEEEDKRDRGVSKNEGQGQPCLLQNHRRRGWKSAGNHFGWKGRNEGSEDPFG